jgi:transposase
VQGEGGCEVALDPKLFVPHTPDVQEDMCRILETSLPQVYRFEGFAKGRNASGIRCSICSRLIGHGSHVVAHNGAAHAYCYAREAKAGKVMVLRPAVQWFAEEMERQLRIHDRTKGEEGWREMSEDELFLHLNSEYNELWVAMQDDLATESIIHEAADLANIAMMIADNARRRKEASGHA